VKALIVYETKFGHTEKIAQVIGDALEGEVLPVEEVNPSDLQDFSLVILGSPTHGGFPTEGINNLSNDAAALAGGGRQPPSIPATRRPSLGMPPRKLAAISRKVVPTSWRSQKVFSYLARKAR
jgi:hypothetical protein